ncbi:helix-turn-helix domain-containing protein [Rhodocyclus tenuis]|uniref:Helix-turn-helix domain-containing protein n=1 Tax=Rhodocyclus gracilis TaxID=2929842 RepID=A0ABX0WLA9_9RHOO|nr:helix-turn-helix transcriptional regulator [Rhodocyclus gracilis]NJA89464.1 helix-turn-helix domain-containing protein [Rhodocyclus gracilis]
MNGSDARQLPAPGSISSTSSSDTTSGNPGRAQALGAFLRARRESLDPARVGVSRLGRRRTPGLRRDDVAQLAGISVTWYTRLEQGRSPRASSKVLDAIAAALQCSAAETRHLFTLAGIERASGAALAPACEHLSDSSQAILDQLNPFPAVIQNARFSIIGFNAAYQQLVGVDIAALEKEDRNCLYLALAHPVWRARILDWDEVMPRMVAMFRAAMAEHADDPRWQEQLQRYFAISAEFQHVWQRNEVRGIENQSKRFQHPQLGVLNLQQTNWWSAPKNGDRLLVYLPADEASAESLRCLGKMTAEGAGVGDKVDAGRG